MKRKQDRQFHVVLKDVKGNVLLDVSFFAIDKEQSSGTIAGKVDEIFTVKRLKITRGIE